jgi:serine/threonine protein kinase/Tfp pilus assembly protein PilF
MQGSPEELATGATFAGRYQVIEELGRGGMGRVYKVFDTHIKEKIALKLLRPEIVPDKETVERFSNELKLARKIRHKNVCGMFDLGKAEGTTFITMEFVVGEDLKKFIRKSGQIGPGRAVSFTKQICVGLMEAHHLGIVHRDLKPQNIMIDEDGNARIMDFGIARSLKGKGITGAGVMIGTPEYMSPEQVEGKDVDERSDIYSLGVILYEMVTGRVPFEGETALSIAMKHKGEKPRDPLELNAQIPPDLGRLVLKCLEKDKAKRYQSAAEVRDDLERIEQGLPTTERVAPERKPLTSKKITVQFEPRKLLIPMVLLIAATAAGIGFWRLLARKEAAPAAKIENSIAVISFENQTGDKAFDYLSKAIPNLLITSLEQRGGLYVVTWERMADLLAQMGQKDAETINRESGFRLCRKEGVAAIVLGSVVKAGDVFATDVKVLDVGTRRLLKSAGSRGEGADSILRTQIDELSRAISEGLGMVSGGGASAGAPIIEVTTRSMEAYKFYLQGVEALHKIYLEDARKSLEYAVALDPEFASAFNYLGVAHNYLGNSKACIEAVRKAKALAHKVTEKERLYIEALFEFRVEGRRASGIRILQEIAGKYPKEKMAPLWLGVWYYQAGQYDQAIDECLKVLQLDPENGLAHNFLGYAYLDLGIYDKSVEYFQKYLALYPGDANPVDSLAEAFFRMGRLDDAIAKYKEALAIQPDFLSPPNSLAVLYALKEEPQTALEWSDRRIAQSPSASLKSNGYAFKGFYQCWLGAFKNGLENLDKAQEMRASEESQSARANISRIKSFVYAAKGDYPSARKAMKDWLDVYVKTYPGSEAYYQAFYASFLGFIDLAEGKLDSARTKLANGISSVPDLSPARKELAAFLDGLFQAEMSLAEGDPDKAIAVFGAGNAPAPPLQSETISMIDHNLPFFKDVIARAYQQQGDLDRAIAEYEKLIAFDPASRARFLVHPLYHVRLAKLYEQKGLMTKARERYRKFLELWKDADPGQPEVEEAKARLAALRN